MVQNKKPSIGEVWIFSGTAHYTSGRTKLFSASVSALYGIVHPDERSIIRLDELNHLVHLC